MMEVGSTISGAAVGGYMTFSIPRKSTTELIPFFQKLEDERNSLEIQDLQLSLTTLEEVILYSLTW